MDKREADVLADLELAAQDGTMLVRYDEPFVLTAIPLEEGRWAVARTEEFGGGGQLIVPICGGDGAPLTTQELANFVAHLTTEELARFIIEHGLHVRPRRYAQVVGPPADVAD